MAKKLYEVVIEDEDFNKIFKTRIKHLNKTFALNKALRVFRDQDREEKLIDQVAYISVLEAKIEDHN